MAIGEPSGECYEKIKLHSNHLLDCYENLLTNVIFWGYPLHHQYDQIPFFQKPCKLICNYRE